MALLSWSPALSPHSSLARPHLSTFALGFLLERCLTQPRGFYREAHAASTRSLTEDFLFCTVSDGSILPSHTHTMTVFSPKHL